MRVRVWVNRVCVRGPGGSVSQQAYWVRVVAPVRSCDSRRIRGHKDSPESTERRAGRAQRLHFFSYITHTHTLAVSPLSAGLFLEWAFAASKYIQECVHVCVHVLMGCTDTMHECTLALRCRTSAEAARGSVGPRFHRRPQHRNSEGSAQGVSSRLISLSTHA